MSTSSKARSVGVSVWAHNLFQFYSLQPIIARLKERGQRVRIFTRGAHIPRAAAYFGLPDDSFVDSREWLATRWRVVAGAAPVVGRFYECTRIPADFSSMYRRIRDGARGHMLPNVGNMDRRQVNERYRRVFRRWLPNPFGDDVVLAITPVVDPHWLCAAGLRVVTIAESWDHPVKQPFLHVPDWVFTWNADLQSDLNDYQGLPESGAGYPLKFRYIEELEARVHSAGEGSHLLSNPALRADLERLPPEPFLLYICTTSSRNVRGFQGEVELIRDLAAHAARQGSCLYIKPKPNGLPGELDAFARLSNVIVGAYGTGIESGSMLDPDYHVYRYLLLKRAGLVINVGTTFGLEAALCGMPVMQLSLEANERFGHFAELASNPHIERYLVRGRPVLHYGGNPEELAALIQRARDEGIADEYTRRIRGWLSSGRSVAESVEEVLQALDAPPHF